ncbi:hypothetical protein EXIGLDRAFT_846432 [Exidia glandulosa HHB12029]|uniref:C2H2-type domain-containing protein n=1 Tax=Exidia glandulosa HHB12029 TaxID=1314781 RepID=A0A165AYW0_EXIGL|nr:hypothetical protein EXIGLDRAFT_846432 [Exidia glandulosa HHB12029]
MSSHGQNNGQQQQGSSSSSSQQGNVPLPSIRDILARELQGGSQGTSAGPQRSSLPSQASAQYPGLSAAPRQGTPTPHAGAPSWQAGRGSRTPAPGQQYPSQHPQYAAQPGYGGQAPGGYNVTVDASYAGGAYPQTPAQAQAASAMQPYTGVWRPPAATPAPATMDDADSHTCPVCGRRFDRPSTMRIHLNSHTGDKPSVAERIHAPRTFIDTNVGAIPVRKGDRSHAGNHDLKPVLGNLN